MCQPTLDFSTTGNNPDRIRDGLTTDTPAYTALPSNGAEDQAAFLKRKLGDININRGVHETWQYYDACVNRERNNGLFTADQVLRKNNRGYSGSVYTRQNPNGSHLKICQQQTTGFFKLCVF